MTPRATRAVPIAARASPAMSWLNALRHAVPKERNFRADYPVFAGILRLSLSVEAPPTGVVLVRPRKPQCSQCIQTRVDK